MRYLIVCLGLVASLTGCGRGLAGPTEIDASLIPMVETFKAEGAARGHHLIVEGLTIRFGDLSREGNGNRKGKCSKGQGREIVIDSAAWLDSLPHEQEEILFHELGHCVLDREHVESLRSTKDGTVPVSLMYHSLVPSSVYYLERIGYLDELFH